MTAADEDQPPAELTATPTRRAEDRGVPEVRRGQVLVKAGVGGLVTVGLLLLAYGAWATRRIDQRSEQTHDVACEAVRMLGNEQRQVGRLTVILQDGVAVLIAGPDTQPELVAKLQATLDEVADDEPVPAGVRRLRCDP